MKRVIAGLVAGALWILTSSCGGNDNVLRDAADANRSDTEATGGPDWTTEWIHAAGDGDDDDDLIDEEDLDEAR